VLAITAMTARDRDTNPAAASTGEELVDPGTPVPLS
jgi:hypothetical protein